jgi:hypothetical protein
VRNGRSVGAPFGRQERQPEAGSACREKIRVGREDELAGPIVEGRCQREFGADAGWLAGRDDDASSGQGFLIST